MPPVALPAGLAARLLVVLVLPPLPIASGSAAAAVPVPARLLAGLLAALVAAVEQLLGLPFTGLLLRGPRGRPRDAVCGAASCCMGGAC
jgi:hypothetical protein